MSTKAHSAGNVFNSVWEMETHSVNVSVCECVCVCVCECQLLPQQGRDACDIAETVPV